MRTRIKIGMPPSLCTITLRKKVFSGPVFLQQTLNPILLPFL